ncbi:MAG: energy transducer TonB [Magnetococcales bacterium]|nr:energy transducer TonB [Magnetococcales bacterium]
MNRTVAAMSLLQPVDIAPSDRFSVLQKSVALIVALMLHAGLVAVLLTPELHIPKMSKTPDGFAVVVLPESVSDTTVSIPKSSDPPAPWMHKSPPQPLVEETASPAPRRLPPPVETAAVDPAPPAPAVSEPKVVIPVRPVPMAMPRRRSPPITVPEAAPTPPPVVQTPRQLAPEPEPVSSSEPTTAQQVPSPETSASTPVASLRTTSHSSRSVSRSARTTAPASEQGRRSAEISRFTPPVGQVSLMNNPKPHYPRFARRRGLQGLVLLRVEVDDAGHPLQVSIKRSSGHKVLDRSAVKAVKLWRFIPATRGGVAVRASVDVPIRFSLVKS